MNTFIKEHKFQVGVFILVILVIFFYSYNFNSSKKISSELQFSSFPVSSSGDITCTYPQLLHASYQNNKVTHELPNPETNPIIFTFSNVDSDVAKLKYIDATRTISEVSIVKISEDDEKIIFIEGTGDPYITTHTIYKDLGTATYTKSVSLLGMPSGSLGMGTCI